MQTTLINLFTNKNYSNYENMRWGQLLSLFLAIAWYFALPFDGHKSANIGEGYEMLIVLCYVDYHRIYL